MLMQARAGQSADMYRRPARPGGSGLVLGAGRVLGAA